MERKGRKMALNYAAYCSELSIRLYLFIYLFPDGLLKGSSPQFLSI